MMIVRTSAAVALAVVGSVVLAAGPAPAGVSLSKALRANAPGLLDHARKEGYRNVGVLKFLFQRDEGEPTDHAGPLNLNLARRLELALAVSQRPGKGEVGIIRDASAFAAGTWEGGKASYLTEKGRETLFEAEYPRAWLTPEGREMVAADAFFTGLVKVRTGSPRMTVVVCCFDRKKPGIQKVTEFDASALADDYVAAGQSFRLRVFQDAVPVRAAPPPPKEEKPAEKPKEDKPGEKEPDD